MSAITIYTKSWCPYCIRAKALLSSKGASFDEIDIEKQPQERARMIERAGGRTTVPQIFVGGHHVGGADDLDALEAAGRLDALLGAPA